MLLIHAVSYVGTAFALVFVTLSLASGLLYVSEYIEENSKLAKIWGQRLVFGVIGAHLLFCVFDKLPLHLTVLGILCQVVYLQNIGRNWPVIPVTSAKFLLSVILVFVDHFAWFFYFQDRAREIQRQVVPHGRRNHWKAPHLTPRLEPMTFKDVATFFGICVWLVPFFIFLSLSANENVLPQDFALKSPAPGSTAENGPPVTPKRVGPRVPLLKQILVPILEMIPSKKKTSRSQMDGLIASPSRTRPSSPLGWNSPQLSPAVGSTHPSPYFPPTPTGQGLGIATNMASPRASHGSPTSFYSPSLGSPMRTKPNHKRSFTSPSVQLKKASSSLNLLSSPISSMDKPARGDSNDQLELGDPLAPDAGDEGPQELSHDFPLAGRDVLLDSPSSNISMRRRQ
ncbi:uncharacterized protein L969DRAFT_69354 [Mixia osmundae IAM 14324]|uniref:Uncharacterized protein n=1 Tax=Mixia osmundae (strain CBS 9802 / IAM 14324 / JCM 22182 / KY 12970) TaxID=764103 RepID=G7EAL0_MIXOS|nr:uncharacterized protein L969DRAFT_69354 [Mixia osmundae IAM 14324]KEI42360.1 hypothetical protein L969DRAFT_69354 [Mixia osmundae IAM 14324]GAA99870.1 hypothetical protein E5Q_06573 [Mixia osmundae IAM 14324]